MPKFRFPLRWWFRPDLVGGVWCYYLSGKGRWNHCLRCMLDPRTRHA